MRKIMGWGIVLAAMGSGWAVSQDAELFGRLDANKDGVVTADEVDGEKKSHFERLLRLADENKDGKLSQEEFAKGTKRPEPAAAGGGDRPNRPFGGDFDPKQAFARMDRNSNGKLEKDELPERMQENFARLDANSDGAVDQNEFGRVAGFLAGPRPEGQPDVRRLEETFAKVDANSDGKVTLDEVPQDRREQFQRALERLDDDGDKALTKEQFVRAMLAQRPAGEPEGRPAFQPVMPPLVRALDANGDGEISAEEIAGAAKSLAQLDKNGDGKLTRDELFPQMANLPGRPGEGRPFVAEFISRLKAADANGDGKLSKDEAPDRLKENFDRIDANSDGQLDETELRQMAERFRPGEGRPGQPRPEGRPGEPEKKPENK